MINFQATGILLLLCSQWRW